MLGGALALAAYAAAAAEGGAALRFGLRSPPITFDPRFATDAASTRVNRLLYARLVEFDERFEPVAGIARWERVTPTRYRFTLLGARARFHDGRELTAADVVATYRSVLDEATGSPHRGSLEMLERVEPAGDERVDFVLSRPDALFPGRLAVGILPAERIAAGHPFNEAPLGSGPFRFVERPAEGRIAIRRERDGQRVEFVVVGDATVRVLKLLRGEIDMLQGDLPPELVTWLESRDDVVVSVRDGTTFAYLGFNLEDPATGDPRVRRAIAHAIDREAIVEYLWGGRARLASAILTPDHWAGHPSLEPIEHDPGRARRLLAEAVPPPERPLALVYKTSSDATRIRIASVVQAQLAEVGIDVGVRSYDWGTFYGDVKAGRFQMYSLAWIGIKLPDVFRYTVHSASTPPEGANRGRFRDARADALIEAAEAAQDLDAKAARYRELQAYLLETLPYVPLWFEDQVFVARRGVTGFRVARDGSYDGLADVHRER